MKTLSLIISATPKEIEPAVDIVERFCQSVGADQRTCFEIKVVLAESLGNAIKHGLKGGNHAARVSIDCNTSRGWLVVSTRDQGLPLKGTPNYLFPEAKAQNGRGWPIILSWMDKVEYFSRDGTNYLEMRKELNPQPELRLI